MRESLFRKGDGVLHRELGLYGVVDSKPTWSNGWLYVKWSDGHLGFHEVTELQLIRRAETAYEPGYFATAEALEGDHPYNTPTCSPEAEYAFYCLLAHGKVQPSGA